MDIKTRMKPQIEVIPLLLLLIQYAHLLPAVDSAGVVKSKPTERPISGSHSQTHTDRYLGPEDCLKQQYTQLSCAKVSCPLGYRCLQSNAMCTCDPKPDECYSKEKVCTRDGKEYKTRCHAVAETCKDKNKIPVFSHLGTNCRSNNAFGVSLTVKDVIEVQLPKDSTKALVCQEGWNIAAAHVTCRGMFRTLAKTATNMKYSDVPRKNIILPDVCVPVFCKGHEYSLAECQIGSPVKLSDKSHIAVANCYSIRDNPRPDNKCDKSKFQCANGKCVLPSKTCDGINDCGDGSDEMCCKECRNVNAFHCKSNVCIAQRAHNDGVPDCLDGDDELPAVDSAGVVKSKPTERPISGSHSQTHTDSYLGPEDCLKQQYTQLSCAKVSCPLGHRCSEGDAMCTCDPKPDECYSKEKVCTRDGKEYKTRCHAVAETCKDINTTLVFSHQGTNCRSNNIFGESLKTEKDVIEVQLPKDSTKALVCHEGWNIAAAHVMCRGMFHTLAKTAANMKYSDVPRKNIILPDVCVPVFCKGHEYSLAECQIGSPVKLIDKSHIAVANCYSLSGNPRPDNICDISKFQCANGKCVLPSKTCDGINDCGDGSDEMCCKECRNDKAFHCKSNVCIAQRARNDGVPDCVDGDDEVMTSTPSPLRISV
ncbi:complement factor I-like [Sardina pilchardus]|uniref:complement factor I-like n=1 Tax=Sardina pilchardus TaxID=27697 RepID=UPI002E111AD0